MFYTVGEMAKRIGVAPSTLRYYDKEGLLPFVERSGGGIRMFKEEDFGWLSIIECLKKTGMPIKEIKKFINWGMQGDSTIEERLELITRQRNTVIKQLEELNSTLDMLNYKQWFYETAKKAGTCDYPKSLSDDELPPEILEIKKRINRK